MEGAFMALISLEITLMPQILNVCGEWNDPESFLLMNQGLGKLVLLFVREGIHGSQFPTDRGDEMDENWSAAQHRKAFSEHDRMSINKKLGQS